MCAFFQFLLQRSIVTKLATCRRTGQALKLIQQVKARDAACRKTGQARPGLHDTVKLKGSWRKRTCWKADVIRTSWLQVIGIQMCAFVLFTAAAAKCWLSKQPPAERQARHEDN